MKNLNNFIGPFPRDHAKIEVANWRRIDFKDKEFLFPPVISARNAVYDRTASARSKNHHTWKAVVPLYSEQLLQLSETELKTFLPSSDPRSQE